MHAELTVLSFLSVLVISTILLYRPFRNNSTASTTSICALAPWLLICNAVYGIDAIVWADNTGVHVPVWCDIVTRVLLAANVALPGACVGMLVDLERIASARSMPDKNYTKRTRLIWDVTLCLLIPIFYISLHFIAQDRRFDLVKDFGCVASIYPSTLTTVMMILPSAIVCLVALALSGWTITSTYQQTSSQFIRHLATRSDLSVAGFRRHLVAATLIALVSLVTTCISLTSYGTSSPWISWNDTHAEIGTIDVVENERSIQTAWLGVFIISLIFIVSSIIELERLDSWSNWIPASLSRLGTHTSTRAQDMLLPMIHRNETSKVSLARPYPHDIDIFPGCDSGVHPTVRAGKQARPQPLSIVTRSDEDHDDDVFAAETQRYLQSPIARSLGISSPSPDFSGPSPISFTVDSPFPAVSSSIDDMEGGTVYRRRPSVPEDVDTVSTISTLYDIPWPLPPSEAVPPRVASRFSTIDGTDYPITRALLEQRKSPPVRISSKRFSSVKTVPRNVNVGMTFNTTMFSEAGRF